MQYIAIPMHFVPALFTTPIFEFVVLMDIPLNTLSVNVLFIVFTEVSTEIYENMETSSKSHG